MRRFVSRSLVGSVAVAALLLGPIVSAQAAPVAPVQAAQVSAESSTPVAAAKKKKKKPSAAAFAKKVDKAAVRAAVKKWGTFETTPDTWGGYFAAGKKKDWLVAVSGQAFSAQGRTISVNRYSVDTYRKAVMAKLSRSGLKKVRTFTRGTQVTRSYANARYSCSISYTRLSEEYNPLVTFSCVSTAKVKKAVKKATPFRNAYRKASRTKDLVFSAPTIKASSSPSYRKYRKASIGISPMLGAGGFDGRFAKAPGKKWQFVLGLQAIQECDDWEETRTGRRAWAGEPCIRGTYPDAYEDTVRAW